MSWRLALPLSLALELELDLGLEFGSGLVAPLPGSWVLRLPARRPGRRCAAWSWSLQQLVSSQAGAGAGAFFFFILVTWGSRQITSRTLTLCASGLAYTPHHTCRQGTPQPTHAHAPTPKQAVRANVQPSQPRWRAELHSNLRRGSGAPPGAGCTKGGPVKATPQARCCPPGVVGSLW